MNPEKLSADQIAVILAGHRDRGPKKDPTEPREVTTWFRLNHQISESGCENPECKDPRDRQNDRSTNIVTEIKGKKMCRYCFLDGWLSDANK